MESLIAFKPYHGDSDVRGRGTRQRRKYDIGPRY